MSIIYFLVAVVPALIFTIYNKVRDYHNVTYKELSVSIAANVVVAFISVFLFFFYINATLTDYEILNGMVIDKQRVQVNCEHSYQCNPRIECSTRDGTDCRTVYDTCYEHSHDYNWVVSTTVGDITIGRVDRRGSIEPPRFTRAEIHEPASTSSPFINYLLADPDSLFLYDRSAISAYQGKMPGYPSIYDYYRFNHIVNMTDFNDPKFDWYIKDRLRTIGSTKQVNIIVVITNHSEDFFYALMAHWKGGKKNDVIMVYGIDDEASIKWFRSTSMAMGMNNHLMHNVLRSQALGRNLDMMVMIDHINTIYERFERLSMRELEHLKHNVIVPVWVFLIVLMINLIISYLIGRYVSYN